MTKLDEFKDFVKLHPLLKDEVSSKKRTWQDIYEEWVLFKDDEIWDKFKLEKKEVKERKEEPKDDIIKNVLSYVKKINPDTVTKYVSSIQKIIELVTSFSAGAAEGALSKKKTGDPLFDRRFDEWY
ncbi:MAG: spore coat protein YlbD [Anaeroplasmataceae bacterium]